MAKKKVIKESEPSWSEWYETGSVLADGKKHVSLQRDMVGQDESGQDIVLRFEVKTEVRDGG